MDLVDEKKYIDACKNDLSAFTAIYDEYAQDVYRYCYSLSMEKETAEDAVSFTFLKAIEKIDQYEFRGKSIKAWLFIIARNQIYKQGRIKEDSYEEILDPPGESEGILEYLVSEENFSEVLIIIDSLKDQEKEVLRLKIWEELQFDEIAEIMEIGVSSVKMRYYRALEKIKEKVS
jgi:RNA polymerase sigma-70 factor (ECF subfamily)